ncbi:MAG TPA: glycosyltransferase, partial [Polyangiaceae bacterium]
MNTWIILAPEYPPAIGGISDYLGQLTAALVAAGDEVDLFAPTPVAPSADPRLRVHELPRGYDRRAWPRIEQLARERRDAVTLLQYLPFLFGHPGRLRHLLTWPGPLWVMFHEAAYPFEPGQALRHRALAIGTHLAARALAARADRVLVSTPGCESALEKFGKSSFSAVWLPIPSNLSRAPQPRSRETVLAEHGLDPGKPIVGHFSAFG